MVSCYSSFTPGQWEDYSNTNILKSEKEQNASATLRGVVTEILDQATQDILLQRQNVNRAFEKRIKEVQEAHNTLSNHLEKVQILLIVLYIQLYYLTCRLSKRSVRWKEILSLLKLQ